MDDKIVQYIEDNGITFELRALDSDGETIIKFTSQTSADNLVGDAWKIDRFIDEMALEQPDEDFSGATEGDR